MGFIGVGNRGSQLLTLFNDNKDVDVAALCDVYKPYSTRKRSQVEKRYIESGKVPKMKDNLGDYKQYDDFRRLLEDKDIDAVCIPTPDHWHAIQTIQAMVSGFSQYTSFPASIA